MKREKVIVDLRCATSEDILELYGCLKELDESLFIRVESDFSRGVVKLHSADCFLYYIDGEWMRCNGFETKGRELLSIRQFKDFLYSL